MTRSDAGDRNAWSTTRMILSDRFREALVLTFDLHRDQQRKGSGVPYMAHVLGVCSLVMENGGDEDTAIAALLHDTVEDQGGHSTLRDIERRFGAAVAAIVHGCTESAEDPKPPWRERKERYLAHLKDAPPNVQLVAACDKLHNAQSILADYAVVGDALWSRFSGGRDGVLWFYRVAANAFTVDSPVVRALHRAVEELEQRVSRDS
jgi:(p)ppGpp synthase/HD superfamily hydrolase